MNRILVAVAAVCLAAGSTQAQYDQGVSRDYVDMAISVAGDGDTNAVWGNITGTLADQADVWAEFTNRYTKAEALALLTAFGGSTNIEILGTIATGVWQGTAIDVTYLDPLTIAATNVIAGANTHVLKQDGTYIVSLDVGTLLLEYPKTNEVPLWETETLFTNWNVSVWVPFTNSLHTFPIVQGFLYEPGSTNAHLTLDGGPLTNLNGAAVQPQSIDTNSMSGAANDLYKNVAASDTLATVLARGNDGNNLTITNLLRIGSTNGPYASIETSSGTLKYGDNERIEWDESKLVAGATDMLNWSVRALLGAWRVDGPATQGLDVVNYQDMTNYVGDLGLATGTPVYVEIDPHSLYLDGSTAMSGNLNMGGNSITNISTNTLRYADGQSVIQKMELRDTVVTNTLRPLIAKLQGGTNNWNTAYGWGNHSVAGYALNTKLVIVSNRVNTLRLGTNNWNSAFAWGNHASAGYAANTKLVGVSNRVAKMELRTNLWEAAYTWDCKDFAIYQPDQAKMKHRYARILKTPKVHFPKGIRITQVDADLSTNNVTYSFTFVTATNILGAGASTLGVVTVTNKSSRSLSGLTWNVASNRYVLLDLSATDVEEIGGTLRYAVRE